ncbi:peptide deformylase [Alphaproteobacteria bacterium HT1-32]|nr:peptide deformylase [Alphaproteobacteria bacterium HT1-32]|tara:strand:- start:99928 stop:100446 length:519 start_codon:yes stop_codon:yes gene_type:complete
MALLPIITAPDPRLKVVSEPVDAVTDDIRQLMDDMLETMYDAPGVGLAAPQVGVTKRVIVIDTASSDEDPAPMRLANPEVVWESEETKVYDEGCLSLPEYYSDVERPDRVRVRYLDYDGASQEIEVDGLTAVCIQHEIDHLDGILFVDHISRVKREVILRKLTKARKLAASG